MKLAVDLTDVCIVDSEDGYSDAAFEKMKVVVGLELLQPTDVGVFHYEQTDYQTTHQSTCAVLSNHGTRVCIELVTSCFHCFKILTCYTYPHSFFYRRVAPPF